MNIFTVKWGTKYSVEHVERLFTSISEQSHESFTFYCLTDNPIGLDKNIQVIEIPTAPLEKWWNKMYLFDKRFVTTTDNLYFDLDVIIQHSVDSFMHVNPRQCLCFAKTYWHNLEQQQKDTRHIPHKFTELNSSVLRWTGALNTEDITEYFQKFQKQILWYYRGIDNFFAHRKICDITYFPIGWVYSFNHGYIYPHDVEPHVYRELPYLCIFDSMGKHDDVKL